MNDYLTILRKEFDADEGTFLLKFRCFADWDKEVFSRLIQAMEQCAKQHEVRDVIETWIARGFWFSETTTTGLVNRPERRPSEDDDYTGGLCEARRPVLLALLRPQPVRGADTAAVREQL